MTAPDLFPELPACPSPKLRFLRAHGLEVEFSPSPGEDESPWVCRKKYPRLGHHWLSSEIGGGATEDEAIIDYCVNARVRHYSLNS